MTQPLTKTNHIIGWGLLTGLITLVFFVSCVLYIDFEILKPLHQVNNSHIKFFLLIVSILISAFVVNSIIRILAYRLNHAYQKHFHYLPHLGTFGESLPRTYTGEKKYDHIVLLLHGFTASPQEFDFLLHELEKANIPFHAPLITGFGQNTTEMLQKIRYEDWFRIVLAHFDTLSHMAKKVSVIGHSMGGLLATFIAQHRSVHRLILSAPGFYVTKPDRKYKILMLTPVLSSLFISLIPYLPKPIRRGRDVSDTLNETIHPLTFCYMAVPVQAGRALFNAQQSVDVTKIRQTEMLLIYGKHDITVDMKRCIKQLTDGNIIFKQIVLENTAHNVFEDFDSRESCQVAIDFLTHNNANAH